MSSELIEVKEKRVLIITYYWPPSGGGGVQRWLKMSKYLARLGWKVYVYTPANPSVEEQDLLLEQEVDESITIIKRNIIEPYSILNAFSGKKRKFSQGVVSHHDTRGLKERVLLWIREHFFIPDPRVFWVSPSIEFLKRFVQKEQLSLIVTSGPPHSMHLIGLGLKEHFRTDIRWISDFRDPWSKWDILDKIVKSDKVRSRHADLEKRVLTSSDLTLTVSETWAKEFGQLGAKKVEVITNGYDSEDFTNQQLHYGPGTICHYGLLNEFRNYEFLWEGLNDLLKEGVKVSLTLGGIVDDKVRRSLGCYPELTENITFNGYVSHDSVLKKYSESQILLLLSNNTDNNLGHLPGKFFEYVRSGRPILAVAKIDSDLSKYILQYHLGEVLDPTQVSSNDVVETLKRLMSLDFSVKNQIEKFDREVITKKLEQLLLTL